MVQAILLDPEARGDVKTDPNYGKLREPAQYINGFLRAFNVKSFDKLSTSDGVLGDRSSADFTGSLDQPIFQPTTVFSYYQPGYEVPGTKILGPAFGILSTTTTLRRANNINTLIYTGVSINSHADGGESGSTARYFDRYRQPGSTGRKSDRRSQRARCVAAARNDAPADAHFHRHRDERHQRRKRRNA